MSNRTVNLSVDTTSDEEFVTIFERLARQCAGLILDAIEARVYGCEPDEDTNA